jgi:hypothetical protein
LCRFLDCFWLFTISRVWDWSELTGRRAGLETIFGTHSPSSTAAPLLGIVLLGGGSDVRAFTLFADEAVNSTGPQLVAPNQWGVRVSNWLPRRVRG